MIVALAPDRGRSADRRADYHDPALPPRHALVAFGLWLQRAWAHALVHVGAHGTLEWLPGKTVALSAACFPGGGHRGAAGGLSVHRQQSRRGGAGEAADRGGDARAPDAAAGGGGAERGARALERLVDEYAQAEGLDRRRRERLARLIVEEAAASGLAGEAGVAAGDDPERRWSGSTPGCAT